MTLLFLFCFSFASHLQGNKFNKFSTRWKNNKCDINHRDHSNVFISFNSSLLARHQPLTYLLRERLNCSSRFNSWRKKYQLHILGRLSAHKFLLRVEKCFLKSRQLKQLPIYLKPFLPSRGGDEGIMYMFSILHISKHDLSDAAHTRCKVWGSKSN